MEPCKKSFPKFTTIRANLFEWLAVFTNFCRHNLMKSLVKILLFVVHVAADRLHAYPVIGARALFKQYITNFNKSYTISDESRFAAFKRTLEEIQSLRTAQQHAHFGVNEYSDLTTEEREHMRCGITKKRQLRQSRMCLRIFLIAANMTYC